MVLVPVHVASLSLAAVHFRLPPGACVWSPHSHGPCGCQHHTAVWSWVRMRTPMVKCITKWARERGREAPFWRPWATWLLGPHGHGENRRGHCASVGHKPARASLFPWVYIRLGVGQTRCFLKMSSQLSKLSSASVSPSSH